jgi:hypothetical protein
MAGELVAVALDHPPAVRRLAVLDIVPTGDAWDRADARFAVGSAHVHAVCEEYRTAAGIDRDHDAADQRAGRRITCPALVLRPRAARWTPGIPRRAARWGYGGSGPPTCRAPL